ncbi:variable surface protein [Plasmodium gonderi]|uniref:Variable surface protein n=1 Tax=Plasmodium gonderi TaxID=77519 RepID=A0A1Y1JCW5_PLAGO|nr:variable surface protein [Plasmodium gonderi]GAW79047.1 variable surface protein [Plasmodium gonderi]
MSEKRLVDTVLIKSIQDEYPLLNIWPKVNADKLFRVNSSYESICKEINEQSNGDVGSDTCQTFFAYLEDIVRDEYNETVRGIYDDLINLNYEDEVSYNVYSYQFWNFLHYFKKIAKNKMYKNIYMIKNLYEDNDKLKGIMKLFYFDENVGDIKNVLENYHNKDYKKTCEFVNECIDVYRDFLNYTCPTEYYDKFSDSTVCNELYVFFDNYDKILYHPLKKYDRITSLREYPDTARVRCDYDEPMYSYYPIFAFFKHISRGVTPFGFSSITFFSLLAIFLCLFILYKVRMLFTPVGLHFSPQKKKIKNAWKNIQREHERATRSNNDQESDKSEVTDDDSTVTDDSFNIRYQSTRS